METRVLIPPGSKPNATIAIGGLVAEVFVFESVKAQSDDGSGPIL